MKNTLVFTAVAAVLGTVSFNANALQNGDTLTIDGGTGVVSCILGTTPPCTDTRFNETGQTGSYFILGGGTTTLTGNQGIVLGTVQTAADSHPGAINGTESPTIDNPWEFSSNTGMHGSVSPLTAISDTLIDMSGWSVTWAGIPAINMGGCGAATDATCGGNINTGTASITVTGDTYVLDYFANVPIGDPSGFGGAGYTLHLTGSVVSGVPVPAAVWLFGSGLVGLAGVARRRKANA